MGSCFQPKQVSPWAYKRILLKVEMKKQNAMIFQENKTSGRISG